MGSRGIALLLLLISALDGGRWSTPRPCRFTPGKEPVPIVQEAEWAPWPFWTGAEKLASNGIRSRIIKPVASRHADWAIPAHYYLVAKVIHIHFLRSHKCVCVYIYIYIYIQYTHRVICVYIYIYYIYTHTHTFVTARVCIYIYIHTVIYVYIYIYTYICDCIYIYIYTQTHIHTHIHTHTYSSQYRDDDRTKYINNIGTAVNATCQESLYMCHFVHASRRFGSPELTHGQ